VSVDATVTLITPDATRRTALRSELALSPAFCARFRLVRLLGAGGSSTVHLAEDRARGDLVAIKFLTRQGSAAERARFQQESRMLARLDHVNVVSVRETGEEGGHPYLVMEYVPGGTLRSLLKQCGRLPVAQALDLATDLLAGLAALHARGIVHRDLKPDNVLLDAGGRARLADLGIALDRGAGGDTFEPGCLVGTPKYMAPEQALGETASDASDVYGVGLILYEMLAGDGPFDGRVADRLLAQHVSAVPAPIRSRVPWVPDELARLIDQVLAKKPEQRPSVLALRAALVACRPSVQPAIARPTYRLAVDREVLERARTSERSAVALLYQEYASVVRAYLLRNAGPVGLRERTMTVFRIAHDCMPRIGGPVSFAHLLHKIATAVADA
jgi:serine/threonine protein kinase